MIQVFSRQKSRLLILTLAAVLCLPAAASSAAEVDVVVGTDVSSSYVWRGITLNEDAVLQPSVDISHESGLGINFWGNMDLGDNNGALDNGEFSEVDITLSYAFPIEKFDLSTGLIFYLFPQAGTNTSTEEIYLSGGYSLTESLSAGADVYYDWDVADGLYANISSSLDIGALVELPEGLGLGLSAGVGFADDNFASVNGGGSDGGAFDLNVSLSASLAYSEQTEVTGFLSYTDNLDSNVLTEQATELYGGIGIYHTF